MEQDLSLMKQLLTLNEEIEELKWRRRYLGWGAASSRTSTAASSNYSLLTSSGDVLGASATSSEGWWGDSNDHIPSKYPGISTLSLHADCGHNRLSIFEEGEEEEKETISAAANNILSTFALSLSSSASAEAVVVHGDDSHNIASSQRTLARSGSNASARTLRSSCSSHHYGGGGHEDCDVIDDDDKVDNVITDVIVDPDTSSTPGAVRDYISRANAVKSREFASDTRDFMERESFDSGIHEGYTDSSLPRTDSLRRTDGVSLLRTNSRTEMTHL